MLIEFGVGNFKSFKDVETFSLVAANIRSKVSDIDSSNVFTVDKDFSLIKCAALYGANASGKSNFVGALSFMRRFVVNSSKETQSQDEIPVDEFKLDSSTIGKPSFFQIVFLVDGRPYRYGFEVTRNEVVSEWLFHVPTIKEAKLFQRSFDEISCSPKFKEGKGLQEKTRNNALFLSVVAQFNGRVSQQILQWFRHFNIISGLGDFTRDYTIECLHSNENKDDILAFIKKLDLGINDIEIEKTTFEATLPKSLPPDLRDAILKNAIEDSFKVKAVHKVFDRKGESVALQIFDFDKQESEGTKKLFSLAGPLMDTLRNGKILLIDEFDARLHPLISQEIVRLFNSNETNPKNAQLIFTTHDTNLLNNKLFRRDQIWFAEKDKKGATHLYSLVEYKVSRDLSVRNDASFESDYIKGRYGAIPFIGDLGRLFEDLNG